MSWKNILGIGDPLDDMKNYFKTRKFKALTKKYIKDISGDSFMSYGLTLHPELGGKHPFYKFEEKEWESAGLHMKEEVELSFIEELDANWSDIWDKRRRELLSNFNYEESIGDEG